MPAYDSNRARPLGPDTTGEAVPAAAPAREVEGDRLPRLAVLGRVMASVLGILATLALASLSVVLLGQAAGLIEGEVADVLSLLAAGLLCAALAALSAGVAHAAAWMAEAKVREGAMLVTVHDSQGHVLKVERQSGALARTPREALLGAALFGRVLVADRPAFMAAVRVAAQGRKPVSADLRLACAEEGSHFLPFDVRCLPAQGTRRVKAARARLVWREAIVPKLRADEEARARADAEQANAAKSRFLAAMSHELRTPLNAILGFSELLATDVGAGLDEARKAEYARIIHDSGQHLLGLVNDILDLSRVEAGACALEPEPVDIAELVASSAEMVTLEAGRKSVRLRALVASGLPRLSADKRALRQIVLNLLSNAVKFTPEGGRVQLTVRRQAGRLVLKVRDTGPGMKPQDVARLGEPFFQAGDSTQKARGSGLGLAVVKGLVELHQGGFRVDSAPGRGTTVTVTLPLGAAAPLTDLKDDGVVASFPPRRITETRTRMMA